MGRRAKSVIGIRVVIETAIKKPEDLINSKDPDAIAAAANSFDFIHNQAEKENNEYLVEVQMSARDPHCSSSEPDTTMFVRACFCKCRENIDKFIFGSKKGTNSKK